MCGPVLGVSQSSALKILSQPLVWLVPGITPWNIFPLRHNIEQPITNGLLPPGPPDMHVSLQPQSLMFPLAGSQTAGPQQYFSVKPQFKYLLSVHLPSDNSGCFHLLQEALPSKTMGCPSFHLHITSHMLTLALTTTFLMASTATDSPHKTCFIMPPELFKCHFH